MVNRLNKNIRKCPKCKIKLIEYFSKLECEFTRKTIYKRCPKCLEVWEIVLNLKKKD